MGSGKKVILSARGNGTDGVLNKIVVNLEPAIAEVLADLVVAGGKVVESFAYHAFGQHLLVLPEDIRLWVSPFLVDGQLSTIS